jgi:hypothetical protein
MKSRAFHWRGSLLLSLSCSLLPLTAGTVDINVFATGSVVNATGPDSISVGNGSLWAAYTNGAASDGSNGSSTIVQYDLNGSVLKTYTIAGSVDGLKINPNDGKVWALQNQDASSALTIIDPIAQSTTLLTYAVTSSTRGYDDVVFTSSQTFLSQTNPALGTDPTIVQLTNSTSPLTVTPVLLSGATGTNLANGSTGPTIQTDPDSLKLSPNGTLVLTGETDGALTFVSNPGTGGQSVSFLQLLSGGSNVSGLDDTAYATSSAGTFFLADTKNNRILRIQASGLPAGSLYASLIGLNELAGVDLATGNVTPLVSGLNAPHGLAFVPAPEPAPSLLLLAGLGALAILRRWRR